MTPDQRGIPADARAGGQQPKTSRPPVMPGPLRMTVNLTPNAEKALSRLVGGWGANKTDVVNRSLQLAERLQRLTVDGCLMVEVDGRRIEVHLI